MRVIAVQCPRCRLTEQVTATSVLLEVGTSTEDGRSCSASWICDVCHELVALTVDLTTLIALVGAGVSVLATAAEYARAAYPETAVGGPALSRDDLLVFHELLSDDERPARALRTGRAR